mgnify:CR=1 FL=1
MIGPGSTIGILGGGQLGRMTALAAARLGYRSHVLCPEADAPAVLVSARHTRADYDDPGALDAFADAVDVVTAEFENVPADTLARLADRVPVRPARDVQGVAQDRLSEKRLCREQGIATAPFHAVHGPEDVARAVDDVGGHALLKTTRLGYDGKGQQPVTGDSDAAAVWAAHPHAVGVVEGLVDFAAEISVIVARTPGGATAAWDPVENRHQNGVLRTTRAPAGVSPDVAETARDTALRLAGALDVAGLLAVEMFVTGDGGVLVNEMAPRPHNTGHWTLDACVTDQFEQLVRAICDLPLGSTERTADAVMDNLLGDETADWPDILADPRARLHLYGKTESRPGRKMGHVTRLYLAGEGLPG